VEVSVQNYSAKNVWFDDVRVVTVEEMVVQVNHYDPWGQHLPELELPGKPEHLSQFTGQPRLREGETEWSDFGARYYDARLGRWHAPDPVQQQFSPYAALGNSPARRAVNKPDFAPLLKKISPKSRCPPGTKNQTGSSANIYQGRSELLFYERQAVHPFAVSGHYGIEPGGQRGHIEGGAGAVESNRHGQAVAVVHGGGSGFGAGRQLQPQRSGGGVGEDPGAVGVGFSGQLIAGLRGGQWRRTRPRHREARR
jgi:RHS repeat-associated protein